MVFFFEKYKVAQSGRVFNLEIADNEKKIKGVVPEKEAREETTIALYPCKGLGTLIKYG